MRPGQRRLVVIGLIQIGPDATPARALVRNDNVAVLVFTGKLNFDVLSGIQLYRLVGFHEFAGRNQCFRFATNVDNDADIRDRDNSALDDFAFRRRLLRCRVLIHQLIEFFVGWRGRFIDRGGCFRRQVPGTKRIPYPLQMH